MKFLCRVGLHNWKKERAVISTGYKCKNCPKWKTYKGFLVEEERKALKHLKETINPNESPN